MKLIFKKKRHPKGCLMMNHEDADYFPPRKLSFI